MNPDRVLLLGVDGGGTSTTACLSDELGTVLGVGRGGPSNIKSVGGDAAQAALNQAIGAAFEDAGRIPSPVTVCCLGLAGFDRPEDKDWLRGWAESTGFLGRLVLVNDGNLVVAAGTPEGWGVGLIAGTGSIAVGQDARGRTGRAGGWGHLIGDEGSGFGVAISALRRIAWMADGRLPGGSDNPLCIKVCEALEIEGPAQLIRRLYGTPFDRAGIAAIAPAVLDASKEDPSIVAEILEPAGASLAMMVAAVARQLDWHGGRLALGLAGSFLLRSDTLCSILLRHLHSMGYDVHATRVEEPVMGALTLARRALLGSDPR